MKLITKIVLLMFIVLLVGSVLSYDAQAIDSKTMGDIPKYVSEYLNNGSTANAVGDYSNGEEFYFQPVNKTVRLFRLIVSIRDTTIDNTNDYGAITNGLTNGIEFWIRQNGTDTRIDGGSGKNTKTNGDYHRLCYDVDYANLGNGDDYVAVRWTFANSGTLIRLNGSNGDKIYAKFNDSFTGLVEHYFLVQGYEELQGENVTNITDIGVSLFFIILTFGLFLIPLFVKFVEDDDYNLIIRKIFWVFGMSILAFSTTAFATLSNIGGLGLEEQLFVFQWFFLKGLYIAMVLLFFNIMVTLVRKWKVEKQKKRMGEDVT